MTFSQFALLLRTRWLILAIGAAIGVALAAVLAQFAPPSYEATAEVLVDVRAPETVGNQSVANQLATDYVLTQLDILRSDRLANRVAAQLRRSKNVSAAAVFDKYTVRNLTLIPTTGSRVIAIRYAAPNPADAAIVANAFAQAYADVSLDLQADPARQSANWYAARASFVQKQLTGAQGRLSQRQRELGITADQDTNDADSVRLGGLSGQLAMAQAQQAALSTRTQGEALPDAMNSPVMRGIQTDLARLEAQRQQLSVFAGPNNLDYLQITRQIETLRAKVAEEQALVRRSVAITSQQAAASVRNLNSAVSAQKDRVIAARNNRSDVAALQQDVDNLKTTYEQIVTRRAQLGLLSQGTGTNVTLLSPASPAEKPAFPKPKLLLPIGLVLGIILSCVLVVMLALINPRLQLANDIADRLGIPCLGTVRLAPPKSRASRRAPLLAHQVKS